MDNDLVVKRVLIVSDSHGQTVDIRKAIVNTGEIDLFIHLGDIIDDPDIIRQWLMGKCGLKAKEIPSLFLAGNCDGRWLKRKLHRRPVLFRVNGLAFFATHGDAYGVEDGLERLQELAEANDIDVMLFGHTHIPYEGIYGKTRILNPGSISYPRAGQPKTYIVLTFYGEKRYDVKIKRMD